MGLSLKGDYMSQAGSLIYSGVFTYLGSGLFYTVTSKVLEEEQRAVGTVGGMLAAVTLSVIGYCRMRQGK